MLFSLLGRHGSPDDSMRRNNQAARITPSLLPEPEDAVQQYEASGGHLTIFSSFGEDPLRDRLDLVNQREAEFLKKYPDFGGFFYHVVNGDHSLFREGLLFLIDISKHLELQL